MDPEYTLVAHIIVVQYESWHKEFKNVARTLCPRTLSAAFP
jgi:hypothetical protein